MGTGATDVTTRAQRRSLTAGIFVVIISMAFESVGVSTAMPAAAQDLQGLSLYAWAFSLFVVGQLTATVVTGRACDRIGPVRPALFGLAVFAAGLVVAGTATTMPVLLAGRFVQGIGVGAANLALTVVIALAYPEGERPVVMTWISTAWVLPSLVGPPVAAWITGTLSWHWVFLVILPIVALAAVFVVPPVLRLQPALAGVRTAEASPVPLWCGFAVSLGSVVLQLAGQRSSAGHRGAAEVVAVVVALVVLALALPRTMPPGFLRLGRGLPAVVACRAVGAGAYFGALAFIPLMFVETRGVSLLVAGGMVSVGSLGWTLGSWVQARPWLRIARQRLIVVGLLLVAGGAVTMAGAAWFERSSLLLIALLWVPAGLGMGLFMASTNLAVMSLSTTAQQGRNSASLQVGEALGNSILVGLAGTIFATLHATHTPRLTFTVVMAAMAVLGLASVLLAARIGPIRSVD